MGVRVKEAGESERRLVTRWIGIEGSRRYHPARKGADFRLVSDRKRPCRTFFRRTGK
jgi:hypothetical protein